MSRALALGLAVLAAVLWAGPGSAAQTVSLAVDFAGAQPEQPYPVRCGVPFPRGAVPAVDNIELLNASGKPVPAQVERLAVWPEGSVKWALLNFFARPGDKLVLRFGRDVSARPAGKLIAQRRADGTVVVNTGPVRFAVRPNGSGFIDELAFDANANGKFEPEEELVRAGGAAQRSFLDFVHLSSAESFLAGDFCLSGEPDPSQAVVESVELEAAGPVFASVVIRGHYRYRLLGSTIEGAKTKGRCPFILRLRAFYGWPGVFVQHTFVFDGDPDYDIARAAGLRLPLARPLSGSVVTPGGVTTSLPTAGLSIEGPDAHRVWGVPQGGASDLTIARGGRTLTWLDARGDGFGVLLSVRRGWQNHPKGLVVDRAQGALTLYFWPPEAGPLDFRRYSREWGVGETGAGSRDIKRYSRFAAKGAAKTHEALLYFHRPEATERALAELARAFDERPLAVASPQYYAQTEALGRYHIADEQLFPEAEALLRNLADYWLDSREKFRWYGFFDYGDVQQWFNKGPARTRWARDFGRWGWAANDGAGRVSWMYALQFLRTLDRRYFEMAEANAMHIYDACMVNSKEYPWDWGEFRDVSGCVHRHNVQPWGCPYVGARGACPTGAKIVYFLTGDGRLKDALDLVLRMSEERLAGDVQRTGHSGGLGAPDGAGTMAQAFIYAWEVTGGDSYREKALRTIRSCKMPPKSAWDALMTGAFGLYHGAAEIYDLTGDPWCRECIRVVAEVISDPKLEKHWSYPNGYFRMFADAARVSHEPKYRRALARALAALLKKAGSCAEMALPRELWPGRPLDPPPMTDANVGRDLPYALEAIALTGGPQAYRVEEEK